MDVRQLRAFVAVVREGTIRGAAASLDLAQSTVSEAIAALDRALGVPVLRRSRGAQAMPLTAAGHALLPHAIRTLEEIAAAQLAVAATARASEGSLTVAANESVCTYLLPAPLAVLRKTWSKTKFAVSIETCANVRRRVATGRCQVGLLLEPEQPSNVRRQPAGTEPRTLRGRIAMNLFSAPRHALARHRQRPLGLDQLASYPLFTSDAIGELPDLLRRYFGSSGRGGPRMQAVGTIEGVRRAVLSDDPAIGILPAYALVDDVAAGRVSILNVEPAPPVLRLVALLPISSLQRHPAVDELLGQLEQAR